MKSKVICSILVALFLFSFGAKLSYANIKAHSQYSNTQKNPWSILVYMGKMTDKRLNQILRFDISVDHATLFGAEADYDLTQTNSVYKFFKHISADSFLAVNITYQDDKDVNIYEINPYFGLKWQNFSWDKYIKTVFSVGEGVSYASGIPNRELHFANNARYAKKFLNFLSFEAGFALPNHPSLQLVYKIHHRSGCFGLYKSSNSGSTAVALGIRYFL